MERSAAAPMLWQSCLSIGGRFTLRSQVPMGEGFRGLEFRVEVLKIWVIVMVIQVLGKYMII